MKPATATSELVTSEQLNELTIQMEMLSSEEIKDESKLFEITDNKILSHVNNLIPGLIHVGNSVNTAIQAGKESGEVLYKAIIPVGAILTDSKAMEGAVRGIYRGANGIQGHANFVAVNAQQSGTVVANIASATMSVASMVVGQYYMTQINEELSSISNGIDQIMNFQDNEYRSRVFSLLIHIKKIVEFQSEILNNDELRFSKIQQLDRLEEECTQLLGQANLTLVGFTKNDSDYVSYEKTIGNAQKWLEYQKSLLEVLCKIADLRYVLRIGKVSRENCNSLLNTYIKQVQDTQNRLKNWHEETISRLGIDLEKERRPRQDFFDMVLNYIPTLFDEQNGFIAIDRQIVLMISAQSQDCTYNHLIPSSNFYEKDVQLISKEGKIYYLPEM